MTLDSHLPQAGQSEPQPKNNSVDIRDLFPDSGKEQYATLASEVVRIQDQPVTVRLGAVAYTTGGLSERGLGDIDGLRVMIASYISTDKGERLLEHIPSPLAYKAGSYIEDYFNREGEPGDPEWEREQRVASMLAEHGDGHLVTPMPHAKNSHEIQYLTTAPGIRLDQAIYDLNFAHRQGWVTDEEASLMLCGLYRAAELPLQMFRDKEMTHGDSHPGNFEVKLRPSSDGSLPYVTLFEYSYTMFKAERDESPSLHFSDQEILGFDLENFTDDWQAVVKSQDSLAHLQCLPEPDFVVADAATELAGLGVICTRVGLYNIGIETATDLDARAILAAQDRLIASADMPDIAYPTDPSTNP